MGERGITRPSLGEATAKGMTNDAITFLSSSFLDAIAQHNSYIHNVVPVYVVHVCYKHLF